MEVEPEDGCDIEVAWDDVRARSGEVRSRDLWTDVAETSRV